MDYDKLAKQFGGESLDLDKLAEQFGGQVIQPPPEPTLSPEEQVMSQIGADTTGGAGITDIGKLFGAGAVRGTLAAPEALEAGAAGMSRDTTFKPTEFLNYISDPRKLTNDLAQAIGLPKQFEIDAKAGILPEETVAKQRAAVDEALTKGKIKSLRNLTEYGNRVSDRIKDSVSEEMKLALADSQPTGNIIEALETGDFSKISFGKDPSFAGLLGHTAQSVGTFAPALATRVLTKSPTVGGALAFGQAGSEGVDEARKFVEGLSHEQLAKESPYFRNLLVLGYDKDTAKQMTMDKAADSAAYMQGIVGALGNEFTANLMTGKLKGPLIAKARNKATQIIGGTATGMAEEGLQELAEGLATDLGINKAVVREMGADSFANLVLGALGGAGPGAVGGAFARPEQPQAPGAAAPAAPAAPAEPSLTGVRDTIAPAPIDPELQARATMKLEEIFAQATESGNLNKREVNKLAKDLGITPSKDPADTVDAIANLLLQEPTAAPVAEEPVAQAPVAQPPAAPAVEPPVAPAAPAPIVGQAIPEADIEAEETEVAAPAAVPKESELDVSKVATAAIDKMYQAIFDAQQQGKTTVAGIEDSVLRAAKNEGVVFQTPQEVQEFANTNQDKIKAAANQIRQERLKAQTAAPQATEVVKEQAPAEEPKTQAQINQERQAAQRLEGVKAEEVPLGEFQNGIIMGMNGENVNSGLISDDAVKLLKENQLISVDDSGKVGLLPKGKQLLTSMQQTSGVGKEQTPEERKEMFAKFIPQIKGEAKPVEAAPSVEEKAEEPKVKVTANKVFTDDAAEKARALLKSKLNQLNSGIDPEVLQAGIVLSGYHVEKGARTFAAYSAAMIKDLGNAVKPYLKSWYMALKYDPRSEAFKDEMDSADVVDKFEFEKTSEFPDLMTPEGKFEVAQRVSDALLAGAQYDNIAAARQFIKGIIGRTINPGTAEAKEADEAIETGVVLASRAIVDERNSPEETYAKLLDLYNRQPSLNVRSSESVAQQAYSTPAPLAYIASQLAGIDKKTTVYEPTAGNGMLLIGADPKKVTANELNPTRYQMLKRIEDGAELTNDNAMEIDGPKNVDAVIANPPFGSVGETFKITDSYTTKQIDHAISMEALASMKEDGRAVLIVGSVMGTGEDTRRDGYRGKDKREFYYNLYSQYNVVDHFTVSGDLYGKQGAKFPVDVIVINGKGKSERDLPAADLPKVYSSYEQLKEKLDEASRMEPRGVRSTEGVTGGEAATGAGEREGLDRGTVRPSERAGVEGKEPGEGGKPSVSEAGRGAAKPTEPTRAKPSERKLSSLDVLERGNPGQEPVPFSGEGSQRGVGTDVQRSRPESLGGPSTVAGTRVQSRLEDRRGLEEETDTQVTYKPHSEAASVGTLVPVAMRDAIEQSLTRLEDQVGDLDSYVAKSLDMDVEDLRANFSAEQVDALALSIQNASKGKGFIIGDQTGIGKGRVVAAMIKYAIVNGKVPIFVTEKANLYSDMIRDLDDIGMAKELGLDSKKTKILMTDDKSIPYQLVRMEGNEPVEIDMTLRPPASGKQGIDKVLNKLVSDGNLGGYKVIFTTYNQLQTVNQKVTDRAKFVKFFGENNYMIFDESHNAGGSGEKRAKEDAPEPRSKFVRSLVNKAFGTFFSSATYAKRPDVMDLYSSTNMSLAVDKPSMLADAIKHGGVPMQQIVATMLTKDGQYIRRERTFKGVSYDTQDTNVNKQTAENMASAMRSILSFSREKDIVIKQMEKELDKEAKVMYGSTGKVDVEGVNFGSNMHTLIDQMLLALKTQDSVNHAISRLKAGEKVVMTVSNTMGSFIDEFARDLNIKAGEEINLSFADLYIRYLEKQRIVKIKGADNKKVEYRLTDEDLGPTLTAKYEQIRQQILNSGFSAAPVSPIDYMHNELRKAGYKTDEITGRKLILNYASGTPVLQTRTANIKQRVNAVRSFNNGSVDVIILNQAGSTGLSLHASSKFKDKSKRHMIIVQAEKNIDTHMQMLGRVHRTGQVVAPAYSQMMADIPAEMRPAAVLMKKMASLNANTTASRKSAVTAEGVVDFMNDYGGQVAIEYLTDNPDVYEAIGGNDVIKLKEDLEGSEELIRKFTGYIPILPIEQQEEIYGDLISRYNELIDSENAMGTNKLEAKAVDLDAETLSREPITKDKGADSIFSQPAYMERVDVKRTVKPFSKAEVLEMVEKNLDGKTRAEKNGEMRNSLHERTKEYANEKIAKMKESETDPIKIENFKADMGAMYAKMKTILDTYRLGDQVSIKDQNNIFTYGVITNITNAKKTANPSAGSDWKMQIALANGESRSLDINFSQIGTRFELKVVDEVNWLNPETNSGVYIPVIDIFDKGATVRREKRWMVTGNILGGFAQYPGQIITYTKKDGTIGQGVLMSRQFDFEKAKKEAPVYLRTASDVMLFLDKIGGEAGTDDNQLRIIKRGEQYQFITERSKRKGGKYFANDGITRHISFYSRGNDMVAGTFDKAVAETVINYILNVNEMNENIVAKTGVSQAREVFAPKLSQEEINQIRQADKAREGGDFYNNFSENVGEKDIADNIPVVREEIIKEYSALRKAGRRMLDQVAKYGSTVPLQRQLNEMLAQEQNLKQEIAATKTLKNSADDFMARATKALADGDITPEVEAFIRRMYEKYPSVLEGLRLSVKENKTAGKAVGNFAPFKRMVTLWKHTAGVSNPTTIRHELMHSLEQMMTPEAREAVVTEWARALEQAMRENVDKRSRDYFDAVLVFLANPTKENYDAATNKLPSYKFYQYINPSEYWAVNAEKLMAAKLGTPWQRFVNGVNKLIEGLKRFFGFNNKYAVHQALNALLKGDLIRTTDEMLVDYIADGKYKVALLNNVQDEQDLVDKYDLPEVPGHDPRSMKDMMVGAYDSVKNFMTQPNKGNKAQAKLVETVGEAWDDSTMIRIKNAWFGAGLDEADFKRYKGKIRTDNGTAIASVAVKNAIHSGYIATQVILRGALEYSAKFGQFIAVERKTSMANVVRLQYEMRKKLGKKLADQIINGFFVAKRTRSIQNEYLDRFAAVEDLKAALLAAVDPVAREGITADLEEANRKLKNIRIAYEKIPYYMCVLDPKKQYVTVDGQQVPNVMYDQDGLPVINDQAVDDFIDMGKQHPELQQMMDNWRAVNHNLLDNMAFSGRLSKKEVDELKAIKDYVPWYRLMDDEESIYDSSKISGNASGVKHFKAGRTERDVDNVVDSMLHNVSIMTRSSIRNYANNRVVQEYGERRMVKDPKTGEMKPGRLRVYPEGKANKRDETGVYVPIFVNGRRVVVKIPDAQIAEAVTGLALQAPTFMFQDYLSASSNLFRRLITFSGYFQLKQVFYDAPTAAWVSGVRNPFKVWAGTFSGFARAVNPFMDDATVKVLQSAGIGGYQSFHRTEKKERALELGLVTNKNWATLLKAIDHVGDASDYSQRISVYKQVLKETGDPALAMLQASDIIDWQKHGSGRTAMVARSTVTFIQAWATQLDALAQAAMGKGFKGKTQKQALKQFAMTGTALASVCLLYAILAGSDDDYWELDDMTRARNFYVPFSKKATGHHVLIPMHSSAAYFFKVMPEMIYTTIVSQGTKNAVDKSRLARVMGKMFVDSILGPTPVPTGFKAPLEVAIDHNFFTGNNVTPRGMQGLDAAEQYNAATSELGKFLSKLTEIPFTGGEGKPNKRALNPMETDHLIRGMFGSAGALSMWFSNQLFGGPERPKGQLKDNPFLGGIFGADVQRRNEDLMYDLKDKTEESYNTFRKLHMRGKHQEANQYFKDNKGEVQAYAYVLSAEAELKRLNAEIRRVGETVDPKWTPESKRERLNELAEKKNRVLKGVIDMRKRAGL